MSDEIQAISQGNYILHNIDAKKLYVQEPLFTANSGDAVYVGWRPDETVLYSGHISAGAAPTAYSLSEPISAFDSYKVYWLWNQGTDCAGKVNEFYWDADRPNMNNFTLFSVNRFNNTNFSAWGLFEIASNLKDITYTYSQQNTDTANKYIKIKKIVGCNRKENA